MAATRGAKAAKRRRPAAIEASGGSGRQQSGTKSSKSKTSQSTKMAVNKALGKVGGKGRPVTIAQVQNDKSIKASDKTTIINALKRRNKQQTEG